MTNEERALEDLTDDEQTALIESMVHFGATLHQYFMVIYLNFGSTAARYSFLSIAQLATDLSEAALAGDDRPPGPPDPLRPNRPREVG